MRKFFITMAFLVVASLGTASTAEAAFRMRVETGTTTGPGVVISDNGTGDLNSTLGFIVFTDTIGQFVLNVTTGTVTPAASMPGYFDAIDLNNVSINSSGAGTLRLILEADGLGSLTPDGTMVLENSTGGVLTAPAGSSITFTSYADSSNAIPDLGPDVYPSGALAAVSGIGGGSSVSASLTFPPPVGSFSGVATTPFTKSGLYSLYTVVTVTFTGSGSVSFNNVTGTNPAPAGLVLALTGLPVLGIGSWIRRRRSQA